MGLISDGTTVFDAGAMSLGGSMTFIKKLTASSSASLQFIDGASGVVFDSTYKEYVFTFKNIHPQTDNSSLTFQVSTNGGTSYGVNTTTTYFRGQHEEDGASSALTYVGSDDIADESGFIPLSEDCGNDNDQNCSGIMSIFNPADTTFMKHWLHNMSGMQRNDYAFNEFMAGYFNTTSAINAVKFEFGAGAIDAGDICLYGIK
jgi:hypothetical protein